MTQRAAKLAPTSYIINLKSMPLVDTHAHSHFAAFKGETEEVVQRALDQGIVVINVGTQKDTSRGAVELAEKYEKGVYAVIGLHPVHTYSQEVDEEESHFKTREEHFDTVVYHSMAQSPKVVGIGECGLDYYRIQNEKLGMQNVETIKQRQKEAFVAQIRLARELNKALVIHCRPSAGTQDVYEDILHILDEEYGKFEIRNSKFEIHSFTGSPEIVQEFVKRGAFVGLNGIITFDKTGNMEEVVKAVPLEKIVLETDCPYLTPVPFRGKKNEPAYVKYVAQRLAELKGVDANEVANVTTQNAKSLFLIHGDL
jgi:TatD DNase family protein